MNQAAFISFNGTLYPENQPCLPTTDRGFLFGDGLFETMRVSQGTVPLLERHYQRFTHGCQVLRSPLPDFDILHDAIKAILEANHLQEGSLRLSFSRGPGPRGLSLPPHPSPSLLLTTAPIPQSHPTPIRLALSHQHRRDERSILCRVKSLNALPAILARMDAQERGADDALMLNYKGTIAEASSATFLTYWKGSYLTPPLEDGALPGVSRARLLEKGLCYEHTLAPDMIQNVEGAWLITALSVTPIASIDTYPIPLRTDMTETLRDILYGAP
nr:aminotransferase class IV [Saccharibacter sp. 17.LH.SD]